MKIIKIETYKLEIPLKNPFQTALRRVNQIRDVVVQITTDTGLVGFGEAPPTEVITGESPGSILYGIQEILGPKLIGRDVEAMEENQKILHGAMIKNTSAKAALDIALYDLFGKNLGSPLYKVLGGARSFLETDITISVDEPEKMAENASKAKELGYKVLKIKVGKNWRKDIERLERIVDHIGSEIKLRIDANQGWKPREAITILNQLYKKDFNIELVEQPVVYHDMKGLKSVKDATPYPIMADESVFSPEDAHKILEMDAADILNIKLMKTGGIHQALKLADLTALYGKTCMIGCMLESKISVAAAAHIAAAKEVIAYVDLDGPNLTLEEPSQGGPIFEEGRICMTEDAGVGIRCVEGLQEIEGVKW